MKRFEIHLQNGTSFIVEAVVMTQCEATGQVFIYSSTQISFVNLKCVVPASGCVVCLGEVSS